MPPLVYMINQQAILPFSRDEFVKRLDEQTEWDIIIIGGGATGLGAALDAASRGYSTLLLERSDFAKGTSSRSTKLVHGGVRYLAQGDIRLVYGALDERAILLKNAAHLVKPQSFIIPCYSPLSKFKYYLGLKLYDWLSGRFSFGTSSALSKTEVVAELSNINPKTLTGGIAYYDGQFDDSRLAINIAQTCAEKGGIVINYCKVIDLIKEGTKVCGVKFVDLEKGTNYALRAKVVINATGVFVDDILQIDNPGRKPLVQPSQGVHLVLPKKFLPGNSALMIPKTSDGRVLFAVPWHDHVLVGTTDTPLDKHSIEPVALENEINFILETVKHYVTIAPTRQDVLSIFAGLRPLAARGDRKTSTKEISRDHKLIVSESGLITITGGKWTTYRRMAEDTINRAIAVGNLKEVVCSTKNIAIHGCSTASSTDHFTVYGTDAEKIKQLIATDPLLGKRLHSELPYTEAEVIWVTKFEMARTVEDVLARRLRILFLNAKAAVSAAPRVAKLMAQELGFDSAWEQVQLKEFKALAEKYISC